MFNIDLYKIILGRFGEWPLVSISIRCEYILLFYYICIFLALWQFWKAEHLLLALISVLNKCTVMYSNVHFAYRIAPQPKWGKVWYPMVRRCLKSGSLEAKLATVWRGSGWEDPRYNIITIIPITIITMIRIRIKNRVRIRIRINKILIINFIISSKISIIFIIIPKINDIIYLNQPWYHDLSTLLVTILAIHNVERPIPLGSRGW